jgi:hypothetical protein
MVLAKPSHVATLGLLWSLSAAAPARAQGDPVVTPPPVAPAAAPTLEAPAPAAAPTPAAAPAQAQAADQPTSLIPTRFRLNDPARSWAIHATAELGMLAVVSHTIQYSTDGSVFDYVREGGQGGLFPFARLSAELELLHRHSIIFLYQPLTVATQAVLQRDISVDKLIFPAGTPVDLRYGFDFYRLDYQFDFFRSPKYELAIGLGLQLRNARISFTSADGQLRRTNDNLGPVPILRVRGRYTFASGFWLGLEADGFYANIPIANGGNNNVEGAIFDTSLRAGLTVTPFMEAFVNLRYLGGWANGTSSNPTGPGDGFTANYLHTISLSLGVGLR